MTTTKILFLHHSVGRALLKEGLVRDRLAELTPPGRQLALSDHDYNRRGLVGADGQSAGRALPIPHDDTDPSALARLFSSDEPEVAAVRAETLEYDVVAMKSCYPNSAIKSDADQQELEAVYRDLLSALGRLDREFVLATSPPLVALRTNAEQAARARSVATWLSRTAPDLAPNVAVFDLFDLLAAPSGRGANRLRAAYRRRLPVDSHPNRRAWTEIGPIFARELAAAAERASRRRAIEAAP